MTFKRIENTSTGDDAHHGRIGPLPVHQRSYLGIKVVADLLVGRRLHRPPYIHRADGRPREPWAVVDEVGAVKGLTSLRVVDASIIPEAPSATTNFTTIMVAELIYEGVYAR